MGGREGGREGGRQGGAGRGGMTTWHHNIYITIICYAIVHSHEREGSQRQHTECPNHGTLLRAVAAIFHEGLPHRHD